MATLDVKVRVKPEEAVKGYNQARDAQGRFIKAAEEGFKRARDASGKFVKQTTDGLNQVEREAKKTAVALNTGLGSVDKGLTKVAKNVAGLAAAFLSFQAVKGIFNAVIENTQEAEYAMGQLEARVKSTGGVAGFTAKQLSTMASGLQSVTTYGDEAVMQMQTLLLTFKSVRGDTFVQAQGAILDLATVMNTDLQSAAIQVGKALQDPIKGVAMLGRSGIQFSESQKEMIKTLVKSGDLLGAQKIVLGELESQFGGAAKAARDTFGGAMKSLWNTIGDLLEGSVGLDAIKESIEGLIKELNQPAVKSGIAEVVTQTLKLIPLLVEGLGAVVKGFAAIGPHLSTIIEGLTVAAKVAGAYAAVFLGLPAIYNAGTAALASFVAMQKASQVGFLDSIKSIGLLRAAGGVLFAAFAGWQIGTYLRDEFVEVRVFGIAMIEGLLTAWERLKEGVLIVWEGIKATAIGALNFIRGALADLLTSFAAAQDALDLTGLAANSTAKMREWAAAMRPPTSAAADLAAAVSKIHEETNKQIEANKENLGDLAQYEIEQDKAAKATNDTSAAIGNLIPTLSDLGEEAVLTADELKDLASAQEAVQGILNNYAKSLGDDGVKAAIEYKESLVQIAAAEKKLLELHSLDANMQNNLQTARNLANEQYMKRLRIFQETLSPSQQLLKDLEEEEELLQLNTAAMEVERVVRRAINEEKKLGNDLSPEAQENLRQETELHLKNIHALERARDTWEDYNRMIENVSGEAADAIAEFAVSAVTNFDDIGDNFKDLMRNLLNTVKRTVSQMISEMIRLQVLNPMLNSIFGTNLQTGGGMMSMFMGGQRGGSTAQQALSMFGNFAGGNGTATGSGGGGMNFMSLFSGGGSGSGLMAMFGGGGSAGTAVGGWFGSGAGNVSALQSYGVLNTPTGMAGGFAGHGGMAGWGGALAGAAYGSTRGSGGVSTGIATAAGGVAGYYAGGALAATATGGLAAGSAALAAIPVVGWVALAMMAVDMMSGGKLFGTKYKPKGYEQAINIAQGGGTASLQVRETRQAALFGGIRTRYRSLDPGQEATDQASQLYSAIEGAGGQVGSLLGVAGQVVAGSFTRILDKKGNEKEAFSTVFGKKYTEKAEDFAKRMIAEAQIATVDAWLASLSGPSTTNAATDIAEGIDDATKPVTDAISNIGESIGGVAKTAGEAIGGEAHRIAERWRSNAETLSQGAAFLVAAAVDMRNAKNILGDGTLTEITDLIEDMQRGGEALADTYARVKADTQNFEMALDLMGKTIAGTREEFVRMAVDIETAAGGLEAANSLWNRFFEGFYSKQELVTRQAETLRQEATRQLSDLGLAADITMPDFRAAFEEAMPELSAEQIVQWLKAADALYSLNQALDQLGQLVPAAQATSSQFYDAIQNVLQGAELASQAAIKQGSTETRLGIIHLTAARQIAQAIEMLRQRTQDLIASLYGGIPGSLDAINARIAELEGGMTGSFDNVQQEIDNTFERWMDGLAGIQDFLDSILLNSELTTLTPEQQLQEAQRQFAAALAAAQGGNVDALNSLPGLAQTLLENARGFFSSGDQYQAIFDGVRDSMAGLFGVGAPGGGGGGTGGGTIQLVPSDELRELYAARDAAMLQQDAVARTLMSVELANNLRELSAALNTDVLSLADSMGVNLQTLATDLGVHLDELNAASIESLATMASALGLSLTDLTSALGLQLTDLGVGVVELAESVGLNLENLTVESVRGLAELAGSLGVELSELARSVGADLGSLADSQSLLNDALEAEINRLPTAQRDELAPLLHAVETATTEADANAAIAELEGAVRDLSPDLQDIFAPFFDNIDPSNIPPDVRELITANDWLEQILAATLQVRDELSGDGTAPGFASGASMVTSSGAATIHQGEMIVDPVTAGNLRRYGIQVMGGGNSKDVVEALNNLRAEQSRAADDTRAALNCIAERVKSLEDVQREQTNVARATKDALTVGRR